MEFSMGNIQFYWDKETISTSIKEWLIQVLNMCI
jgi:hypothetical protein